MCKDGTKSLRIRIPTSSGGNISIKNRAKTLEVSKKSSRFQDLKRFSCVFDGNVVPTNSGDTISESVLNTFFSKIPIAAWEIGFSGSYPQQRGLALFVGQLTGPGKLKNTTIPPPVS